MKEAELKPTFCFLGQHFATVVLSPRVFSWATSKTGWVLLAFPLGLHSIAEAVCTVGEHHPNCIPYKVRGKHSTHHRFFFITCFLNLHVIADKSDS